MASYQQQAKADAATIREWATELLQDSAAGQDENEVLSDTAKAYIDSEIGDTDPQRVSEIWRQLNRSTS